jgi:hypothetical protein
MRVTRTVLHVFACQWFGIAALDWQSFPAKISYAGTGTLGKTGGRRRRASRWDRFWGPSSRRPRRRRDQNSCHDRGGDLDSRGGCSNVRVGQAQRNGQCGLGIPYQDAKERDDAWTSVTFFCFRTKMADKFDEATQVRAIATHNRLLNPFPERTLGLLREAASRSASSLVNPQFYRNLLG